MKVLHFLSKGYFMIFLIDILEFLEDHVEPDDDFADDDAIDESCHEIIDYEKTFNKDIDNELICWLVKHVWLNDDSRSKGGSILIFLPGFHEIRQLGTDLTNFFYEKRIGELLEEHTKYKQKNLFFLHSQISPDIQKEVFTVKVKIECIVLEITNYLG